jgi:prepilin-type N-terminal cleavage/methylation domain-containing protein
MIVKRAHSGFTLIEVMIAMAILAVISILSAQTMRAGIQDRETVSNEISSDSKVADALRIIRTDINAAYHFRDIFVTIANNAAKPDAAAPPPGGAPPGAPPPPPPPPATTGGAPAPTPRPTPPEVTGFIGDSESMYFTTLSNIRTLQDSQVSDQAKIGYYVKSCKAHEPGNKVVEAKCLYRSISPYLDEEIDKPGEETVLLEHVDKFKLRYVGPGRGTTTEIEYVDSWKTGKNGDAITKANFPYAVEVTLSIDDKDNPKSKRVTASALIPIRFPNNPPKNKDGTPGTGADATTTDDSAQTPQPPPGGPPLKPPGT